jgi:3'-phosphoadenosine 5'-phosphosulfate sulfotransferase (PAPS reductase)/FAD synthetase
VINCAMFSGGKDSTAVLLWLREQEIPHRTVFCDTGWEHPLTTEYVRELDAKLGLNVEWIKSEKYPNGFHQLAVERKVVPGLKTRFCTQELKVFPLWAWIEAQDDEVTTWQGIRAEESEARSKMPRRQFVDEAGGYWIERPIFDWTAAQVFELHKKHGIEPNPLYRMGMKRVGCAPCIMVGKPELRQWALRFPEIRERVEALERDINVDAPADSPRSFFRGDYIPPRFMKTRSCVTKDGRTVPIPTAGEVFDYVTAIDRVQQTLWDEPAMRCLSLYNLCE